MNLNILIKNIQKKLFWNSYKQAQRFGLRGDLYDLAQEILQSVFTKFFNRFENDPAGLEQIVNEGIEAYLMKSIRNFASDLRDKQNHDPTTLRILAKESEEGEVKDELSHIKDNRITQDALAENRQIIKILMSQFDEESINIWLLKGDGLTFREIGEKLNMNHNTVRTKMTAIRLKAYEIINGSNDENN